MDQWLYHQESDPTVYRPGKKLICDLLISLNPSQDKSGGIFILNEYVLYFLTDNLKVHTFVYAWNNSSTAAFLARHLAF